MSTTGGIDVGSAVERQPSVAELLASIAQLNRNETGLRQEAQQARAAERQAYSQLRERDHTLRMVNGRVSELEADNATLRARLAAHLLIEEGYRRLTALYAGQDEGLA